MANTLTDPTPTWGAARGLTVVLFALAAACITQAQETAPTGPAPTNAPPVATGKVAEGTNSATGTNDVAVTLSDLRDPFWPVGYEPEPIVTEVKAGEIKIEEQKSVIAWPQLQLAGLTRKRDGSHMALIRGLGWVSTGDPITCQKKGITYRWIVEEISEQGARCTKQGVVLPGGIHADPVGNVEKEVP